MKETESSPKWAKLKKYPHVDLPIEEGDSLRKVISYIHNPEKIIHHSFAPLIRKVLVRRRYKEREDGRRVRNSKKRQICYACHKDSLIYAYYSFLLGKRYERILKENDLRHVVLAYRKIPNSQSNGNKCNIEFAKNVFSDISKMSENSNVVAMVFDIKGFFDELDHALLKAAWLSLSDDELLPDDEYRVYRQVISYHYVNEGELFNATKGSLWCRHKSGRLIQRAVGEKRYMRDNDVVAFCRKEDLKSLAHLVRKGNCDVFGNPLDKGIPQGLPISANLANIYMLPFDIKVNSALHECGGVYRRYSDDLIIICPEQESERIKSHVMRCIAERKLIIEENKTKAYRFSHDAAGVLKCHRIKEGISHEGQLEYLGLAFNGQKILLKTASVNKFYHKMHQSIRSKVYWAIHGLSRRRGRIFVNQLISRFTLRGAKSISWEKDEGSGKFKKKTRYRGNYLSYVRKASKNGDNRIFRQLRRSRGILERELRKAKARISKELGIQNQRQLYHIRMKDSQGNITRVAIDAKGNVKARIILTPNALDCQIQSDQLSVRPHQGKPSKRESESNADMPKN